MPAAAPAMSPAVVEKPRGTGVPENRESREDEESLWRPVLVLPCLLTVDLPLPNFKVADFLALKSGSVLATHWRLAQDIPLRINGTLIGWAEFEGAGARLAVRVTELT
jgi:flagellar motor switch/type III secretory pathway protein FliN